MEIQQQIILSWVHPYVTLPDLTHFAAAFLDLLLLASGLQSSARPFAWTPHHLRKALAWAAHLERVMADFPASDEGLESRRTFDAALADLMASAQTFPAGLPRLTASDLSNARRLFLQALLQAVAPDSNYFESITDCLIRLDENEGESGVLVKEEVSARNSALRCAESLKVFMESTVGNLVSEKKQITCVTTFWDCSNSAVMADEKLFKAWAGNAMEYVTSSTTVYKTAAANLIFKSREEDWRRVLDTSQAYALNTMVDNGIGNDTEIAELCCLQLAYSDCRDLALRITTSTLNTATDLCQSGERHGGRLMPEGAVSIETFLAEVLKKQVDLWWKLPPVLLAGVCTSRFSMLKTYLKTLTKVAQVRGSSCNCPCHTSSKICHACQRCSNALMERLWCFAVHHPTLRSFEAQQVDSACNYLLNQAQKKSVL